jgi:hypothetical protein
MSNALYVVFSTIIDYANIILVNPENSSSLKEVSARSFSIRYGDGTYGAGDFIKDTVRVGDTSMEQVQMGIARNATQTTGLMGVGYTINVAANTPNATSPFTGLPLEQITYPTIIDNLVKNQVINIPAYSMWLDDLDSSTGSILFGGLDTDKFKGDLQELTVVPEQKSDGTTQYRELRVNLTGMALADSDTKTSAPIVQASSPDSMSVPIVVDSGSALTSLPMDIFQPLVLALGGQALGAFAGVDCDIVTGKPGVTVDFSFKTTSDSTAKISVSAKEMILPLSTLGVTQEQVSGMLNGTQLPFKNVCVLGVMGSAAPPYILGDTFMRSAYVVYDLKNNLIGMATTNFESSTTNIVNFEADQTKLPKASGSSGTATPSTSPTATQSAPTGTKTGAASRSAAGSSWLTVIGGLVAMVYFSCN